MHSQVRHFQQIRKQKQNPKPTNNNNYYKQTKETSSVHVRKADCVRYSHMPVRKFDCEKDRLCENLIVRKTDCIGRAYSLVPVTKPDCEKDRLCENPTV